MALPHTPRATYLTAGFLALCLLTGCQGMKNLGGEKGLSLQSLTGNWLLKELNGKAVSADGLAKEPSINFSPDGKISGFSGVNQFGSSFDVQKLLAGEFSMPQAFSTKMAGPPAAMAFEDEFLKTIQSATGIKLDGNNLLLTKGKEVLMSFVRPG